MPQSTIYFSISGQSKKKRLSCSVNVSHNAFDAGAVVPAAVEDHDFAGRGEMLDVTLEEHLCLFAVRRRRKRHHTKDAGANPFGQRLDCAALAGSIAPLEHYDDLQSLDLTHS